MRRVDDGHINIRATQIHTRIIDQKISRGMDIPAAKRNGALQAQTTIAAQ